MARRHDFWTAQLSLKISTIWGNVSGSGISPHCKDTIPKILNKYSQKKELRGHSPNLHMWKMGTEAAQFPEKEYINGIFGFSAYATVSILVFAN